jgi:hypothetical protein
MRLNISYHFAVLSPPNPEQRPPPYQYRKNCKRSCYNKKDPNLGHVKLEELHSEYTLEDFTCQ